MVATRPQAMNLVLLYEEDKHYDIVLRKHNDDAGDESLAVCKWNEP